MHIAICIVAFHNADDVVRCVQALDLSDYEDFEVIICENGGGRASEILRQLVPGRLSNGQSVTVLSAENDGFAAGVNICIATSATADAWWILNPDTVPACSALSRLCHRLKEGGCDAVASTVHYSDGTVESRGAHWSAWLARATSLDHGRHLREPTNGVQLEARANYLTGASALVSRRFIQETGPMREDYFLYAEEIEWFLRARERGMKLGIAMAALVLHQKGSTTGGVSDVLHRRRLSVYLDERNKLLVVKDRTPLLMPVAAIASLALLVMRFARRGAWAQCGYAIEGWLAGIRSERGKPSWVSREPGRLGPSPPLL